MRTIQREISMDEEQLLDLKNSVSSVLETTGVELMKFYGKIKPESKTNTNSYTADIVTKLDKDTEEYIRNKLKVLFPEIGFRGEESGDLNEGGSDKLTWLVDPIDGTSHFVRGLPFCTTMIALISNGEVVFSMIHDFIEKDFYWAIKGKGSYKNDIKLKMIERNISSSIISFETNLNVGNNRDIEFEVSNLCGGIISTLNCGFEFTRIASGKLDGKITKNPYGKDWDFAPGSLLVEEAGGIVRNHKSDNYSYKKHDFIASTKSVYKALTAKENLPF